MGKLKDQMMGEIPEIPPRYPTATIVGEDGIAVEVQFVNGTHVLLETGE